MRAWHRFLADERGLETVEYAIIAGLIESSLVALIVAVGEWNLGRLKLLGRSLYGT